MKRLVRREMFGRVIVGFLAVTFSTAVGVAWAASEDPLDPAHNTALPCEVVRTPGAIPRSAKNIAHIANVCGIVGTDVEFQSRMATNGLHDYAFLGTMGGGLRIFDITDPANPRAAGRYTDPGWQNDVQVRGNLAAIGFDPISSATASTSACLAGKGATGGVDLVRLIYNTATANFRTALIGCVPASPGNGGAHNSTIHPSGEWLAMISPRANGSVDVVDLVGPGTPNRVYRIVQDATLSNGSATCAGATAAQCRSNGRPGTWSPHDVSFSLDGRTMYVAAVGNDTVLVNVSSVLSGSAPATGVIPNDHNGDGDITDRHDVSLSHQSDPSSDQRIIGITDERGGGLQQTSCNTAPAGIIGGIHFWELPVAGSAGMSARKGAWFYPNPGLLAEHPLVAMALSNLGRLERACTIHVFRMGGNGTAGPGPIQSGVFNGVSSLPSDELVAAHYGAGVWHIDFGAASTDDDGISEDDFSTWGNTLGWNVMPAAETWSAKEYKDHIYAGDMSRGFDVYRFTTCEGIVCVIPPPPCESGDDDLDDDGLDDGLEDIFGRLAGDPDSDDDGVRDGNEDDDGDGTDDEDEDDDSDRCPDDSDGDGTDDEDEDD